MDNHSPMVGFLLPAARSAACAWCGCPRRYAAWVDLLDVLLHAALGEKQPFRDLAVAQPLRHQTHDLELPLRQRGQRRGRTFLSFRCRDASPSSTILSIRSLRISCASKGPARHSSPRRASQRPSGSPSDSACRQHAPAPPCACPAARRRRRSGCGHAAPPGRSASPGTGPAAPRCRR